MLADPSKTTHKSRAVLAFVGLFAITFVASTTITASFSAGELSGLLLAAFLAVAATTLIGWLALIAFSFSVSFRAHRSAPLVAVSMGASLVGGAICVLALAVSILIGHTFAGPIFALQIAWSVALGVLGFLALVGSR